MKYIQITNTIHYEKMYNLWNQEYGYIYPISKELFERNLSNIYQNASFIAYDDEQVVGFIISKIWNDPFYIPTYSESGWISLFFVKKEYRGKGIGSTLFEYSENELRRIGKKIIYLGKDYLNFFPGLPVDLKSSEEWFKKKGFERPYDTFDLIKNLKVCGKEKLPLKNKNIIFRIARLSDKEQLLDFIKKNWPGRWLKETIDYFDNGGTGREYAIGLDNGQICAFAKICYPRTKMELISYSLTWRNRFVALGGIGPLGVDISYRHRNLGYDIVAFANNVLIDSSASDIIIDWTGLLDFYRHMKFEVFKSYYYLNKKL